MCPGWAGGGMTVLLLRRAVRDGPGRGAMEAFQAYGAGCPGVPACLMCSNLLGDQLVEVKVELPLLSHGHAARAGAPAFSVLCTHLQDSYHVALQSMLGGQQVQDAAGSQQLGAATFRHHCGQSAQIISSLNLASFGLAPWQNTAHIFKDITKTAEQTD